MRIISERAEPAFNLLPAERVPGLDRAKFHSPATVALSRSCLIKTPTNVDSRKWRRESRLPLKSRGTGRHQLLPPHGKIIQLV